MLCTVGGKIFFIQIKITANSVLLHSSLTLSSSVSDVNSVSYPLKLLIPSWPAVCLQMTSGISRLILPARNGIVMRAASCGVLLCQPNSATGVTCCAHSPMMSLSPTQTLDLSRSLSSGFQKTVYYVKYLKPQSGLAVLHREV